MSVMVSAPTGSTLTPLATAPTDQAFVRLGQAFCAPFARFLAALQANGDARFFHPHAFDEDSARAIVTRAESGPDEYWLMVGEEVLAYGMLRGWAEGYSVPSLGLAVSPRHRGRGLARSMMSHLHARARDRGAARVRLKVDRHNAAARRLYETLGYVFQDHSDAELLGVLCLADHSDASAQP